MIVEGLVVASKVVFGHGCVYVALLVSLKTNRNQPRILFPLTRHK
jgi:hypothetical protein